MLLHLIGILLVVGHTHSLTFQGCFQLPSSLSGPIVLNVNSSQNNAKCVEVCRKAFFPLAATFGKNCECLTSLPSKVYALASEKDASGPTSRCNKICPGDRGDKCTREDCCGGKGGAISMYSTGNIDLNQKLFKNLEKNLDVVKKPGTKYVAFDWREKTQNKTNLRCGVLINPKGHFPWSCEKEKDLSELNDGSPFVEFFVEDMKEETSRSNPTTSKPFKTEDPELNNINGKKEGTLKKTRAVTKKVGSKFTTESGFEFGFKLGASVSAGFNAFGAEMNVELSTEFSTSTFFKAGHESSSEESITDTIEVSTKVPPGVRTVARFSKRSEDRILKWRSTVYARGQVAVKDDKTPYRNVSLSEIIPSKDRVFYAFGTIRSEANSIISVTLESYDANGKKIKSRKATKEEVKIISPPKKGGIKLDVV